MLKQQLKRDYFRKSLAESRGDSHKLWGKINEAFGKKQKSTAITSLNGKTDPTEVAEELNTFFTTVAGNLVQKCGNSTTAQTGHYTTPSYHLGLSHMTMLRNLFCPCHLALRWVKIPSRPVSLGLS